MPAQQKALTLYAIFMNPLIFCILGLGFISCNQINEVDNKPVYNKVSFPDTLYSKVKFTQLKCGLYINEFSDIAWRNFEVIHDSVHDRYRENHITRVYSNYLESDGGPAYMKNVVDTGTFAILNSYYFKDKSHIYLFTANSDGGIISVLSEADPKSFKVNEQNSELAKDKNHFFRYGYLVDRNKIVEYNVDSLTWR